MKKILIIMNPSSGDKEGAEFGKSVEKLFIEKDYETKLYKTTGDDDFHQLTKDAVADGFLEVALIGGDGTVSEFINEVSNLEKRPKVLLFPLGTTNNFARALGSELSNDQLLSSLEKDELVEKQADVGKINDEYFISTVSVGSIPEVAWQADDELKEQLGSLAYVLEGIKVISDETNDFSVKVSTEEETIEEEEIFLIVIGLSNSVFGIQNFFSDATVNDGDLQLYMLRKSNLFEEAGSMMKHILLDENVDIKNELSLNRSFKHAEIKSEADLNFSVDGEKGPTFPVELGILHNHFTFLIVEKTDLIEQLENLTE